MDTEIQQGNTLKETTNMDYHEFMERAKVKITEDEYEMVNAVYMDCPSNIVGTCVGEFVEWFNKNGKMKAVEMMYAFSVEYANLREKKNHFEDEYNHAKNKIEELEAKVEVYEDIVSEEDLKARLLENIDRNQLLALLSKRRGF